MLGVEPETGEKMSVGLSGLVVMDTSNVPEELEVTVLGKIERITDLVLAGARDSLLMSDPRWANGSSALYH